MYKFIEIDDSGLFIFEPENRSIFEFLTLLQNLKNTPDIYYVKCGTLFIKFSNTNDFLFLPLQKYWLNYEFANSKCDIKYVLSDSIEDVKYRMPVIDINSEIWMQIYGSKIVKEKVYKDDDNPVQFLGKQKKTIFKEIDVKVPLVEYHFCKSEDLEFVVSPKSSNDLSLQSNEISNEFDSEKEDQYQSDSEPDSWFDGDSISSYISSDESSDDYDDIDADDDWWQ